MSFVREGNSPFVAILFKNAFPHATGANEPNVGDVVVINSSRLVERSSANGQKNVLGVVVSKYRGFVDVCTHGVVEVTANAAINVGDMVMSAPNGRVVAIPNAGATYSATDIENLKAKIGKALTPASAAGDKIIIALSVV
jgi:hypothetical protein